MLVLYVVRLVVLPLIAAVGSVWLIAQTYTRDYMEIDTALLFWAGLALAVWMLRWSSYGGAATRWTAWTLCTLVTVQAIIAALFLIGLFPVAVMTAAARGFAMFGPYDGCGWTMWSCYVAPAAAMFFPVRWFIDDWRFRAYF